MAGETQKFPIEYKVDETVSVFVGYTDGRVKIEFATGIPLVGRVSAWLYPQGIPTAKRAILAAEEWMSKPEGIRHTVGQKP